jgi:hypothetical protein
MDNENFSASPPMTSDGCEPVMETGEADAMLVERTSDLTRLMLSVISTPFAGSVYLSTRAKV